MKKKTWKRIIWAFVIMTFIGNFIIYNHAYKFTHFVSNDAEKTKSPEKLSFGEKLNTLFFGINVPKPSNHILPDSSFNTITLQSHEQLEAWEIPVVDPKGTVILFHGYSASKSSLLPYSNEFNKMGYSTFLVDFMGSGGSSGNETTIGVKEGRDVKEAFDYIKKTNPNREIILFGVSMGAASILKSIDQFDIKPDKIILECPFASMVSTTKIRFEAMGLPATPFAEILLCYGGLQSGFNPFKHQPSEYAKKITMPSLLMFGAKDERVKRREIDLIYSNLNGNKNLVVFENSGHEVYLNDHKAEWINNVDSFLKNNSGINNLFQ